MEKFNVTDNNEDDTVEFNMKKTFYFRSDLSNGLTGNEIVTTVHALIMVCTTPSVLSINEVMLLKGRMRGDFFKTRSALPKKSVRKMYYNGFFMSVLLSPNLLFTPSREWHSMLTSIENQC